jgi:hypothetical protein
MLNTLLSTIWSWSGPVQEAPQEKGESEEDRNEYLAALDRASIDADIVPFAALLAKRVRRSMKQASAKTRA